MCKSGKACQNRHMKSTTDWPTVALLFGCYALWALLLFAGPVWLAALLLGPVIALQSSLQHEVLHGHPFPNQTLNEALVWPSLNLVIPYNRFRDTHLQHHNDARLTDPYDDPESNYLDPEVWGALPAWRQAIYQCNNTLIGRLALGPLIGTITFLKSDLLSGDRKIYLQWAAHLPAMTGVMAIVHLSQLPLWLYAITAYIGLSILKLRTFLEHQASERCSGRTAIVESGGVFGFLFLNNNLHSVHHKHPKVAWYRLPALYRANRDHYLQRNGGYFYPSYGAIFRRYALKTKDPVAHPLWQRR